MQCRLHGKENYHQASQHQVDVCNIWWSILSSLVCSCITRLFISPMPCWQHLLASLHFQHQGQCALKIRCSALHKHPSIIINKRLIPWVWFMQEEEEKDRKQQQNNRPMLIDPNLKPWCQINHTVEGSDRQSKAITIMLFIKPRQAQHACY